MTEELTWYYLLNGKSIGPFARGQMVQLLTSGAIAPDVLVWNRADGPDWRAAVELLGSEMPNPPPLPSRDGYASDQSKNQEKPDVGSLSLPHVWRRCFARTLYNTIHGLLMATIIGTVWSVFDAASMERFFAYINKDENQFVAVFFTLLIVPPLNAIVVGYTGSSVGKWFYGIRVYNQSRQPLGVQRALKRELLVWVYGLACGIPLFCQCAALLAGTRLEKKRITYWDQQMNVTVECVPNSLLVYVKGVLGLLAKATIVVLVRDVL